MTAVWEAAAALRDACRTRQDGAIPHLATALRVALDRRLERLRGQSVAIQRLFLTKVLETLTPQVMRRLDIDQMKDLTFFCTVLDVAVDCPMNDQKLATYLDSLHRLRIDRTGPPHGARVRWSEDSLVGTFEALAGRAWSYP